MSDTNLIEKVKARFGDGVLDEHNFRGDQTVTVKRDIGLDFFRIVIQIEKREVILIYFLFSLIANLYYVV